MITCGEAMKKSVLTVFAMAAMVATFSLALTQKIRAQENPPAATIQEVPAIAPDQIAQNIKAAVDSPSRPAQDRALDAGRRPDQMLAFFAIQAGMKVGEIFAGGGYTTQLLSVAVGPAGTVYAQNPVFPPERKQIAEAFQKRLSNPHLKNVIAVSKGYDADDLFGVPPGTLDAVITNMNYHDLVLFHADRDKVNGAVFKALKPGGEYCIVDHSAKAGSGANDVKLHRIDEALVISEVEKSGFKLAAASRALRHPEDDRTWVTNPQGAGARRGTSDRFMLKFVKP
jgi:predicted methyltransferase